MKMETLALMATAVMTSAANTASAQSNVTIYGVLDAGMIRQTGATTQIGKRDNNRLGFRGVEDLGGGLKALVQIETRFEPDTGAVESGSRPLFQGQSRVGLQGGFGTVRLGRGLTPLQESSTAFEPWAGIPTPAGFQTDLTVAGYTSDPLSPAGNSRNRFANAVFYNSPVLQGAQVNLAVATREALVAGGPEPTVYPYSLSATYTAGMLSAMLGIERNAVDSRLWTLAAAVKPAAGWKLMASYQRQDQGATVPANPDTSAWVLGANYVIGNGKVLAGVGRKSQDGMAPARQVSVGYEYSLSARTYLYADAADKRVAASATGATARRTVRYAALGVHHNF